jgi:hypothetical protein
MTVIFVPEPYLKKGRIVTDGDLFGDAVIQKADNGNGLERVD